MKKSQMLKFLFWTIVGLLFFIPSCILASKFLKLGDKELDSYNRLTEYIISIKDGEVISFPYYMDKKSVIAGFSKDDNRFEHNDQGKIASVFNKPIGCSSKACVCICSDYEMNGDTNPKSERCKERLECRSFDNIDILAEKTARKHDDGRPRNTWKGGFIFSRDVTDEANGIEEKDEDPRTIYVERYKNVVNVCFERPCLTNEGKAHIDNFQAIDIEGGKGQVIAPITQPTGQIGTTSDLCNYCGNTKQLFGLNCNERCCKASCPSGTKLVSVPYINQCSRSYGIQTCDGYGEICWKSCGQTSAAMMIRYYGTDTPIESLLLRESGVNRLSSVCPLSWTTGWAGIMNEFASTRFTSSSGDLPLIKQKIDSGKPLISDLNYRGGATGLGFNYGENEAFGHIFVITGYSGNDFIIINDPYTWNYERSWGHNLVIPMNQFMRVWSQNLVYED